MFLTYKGTMPSYLTVMEVGKPIKAGTSWESFKIPGRPGAMLGEKSVEPISISVRFLLEGRDHEEYQRNCEDFAEWLEADKPQPLIFSNNPHRTYYAVAQGEVIPENELVIYSEVTIDFFCPDPFKYGPEKSEVFYDGTAIIDNKGTLPVKPVIYAEVTQELTHLDVMARDAYMRIGEAPEDDGVLVVPTTEDLLLHAPMTNLTGWAYGGLLIDGGEANGTFHTGDGEFYMGDKGTGDTWHGPAFKQAIPGGPLTDFRVEAAMRFNTVKNTTGRAEVYLLSDSGQHIGKLALVNGWTVQNIRLEIRLGGGSNYIFLQRTPNADPRWNNFNGIVRLERKGNEYNYYVAHVDPATGAHSGVIEGRYVDFDNRFTGNLGQVQLHIGNFRVQPPASIAHRDLKVWRLNEVPETDPRIIARVGDMIVLDFPNSAIYINGEERKELKDIFARFFKLPRGSNVLAISPATSVNAVALFREGYR